LTDEVRLQVVGQVVLVVGVGETQVRRLVLRDVDRLLVESVDAGCQVGQISGQLTDDRRLAGLRSQHNKSLQYWQRKTASLLPPTE